MGRRAKPAKVKARAKRPLAGKPPKDEGAKVRDLERRFAESLERETATGALLQEKDRALTEALEQQTATAEILRLISESPTDVQPVFDTIVSTAVRLCEAIYGTVGLVEGDVIVLAAQYNFGREDTDVVRQAYPVPLSSDAPVPRSVRTGSVYRSADVESEPEWQARTEEMRATLRRRGVRSHLAVPMLRRGQAIGVINLTHREVSAFTDAHVELLKTFADQALIAVEDVRLFTELRTSNREQTTALDTQTATSDILRVISRSQTDVHPVFDAILESAVGLLRGYSGVVTRLAGDQIDLGALTSTDDAADAAVRARFPRSLQSEGM